MGSMVMMALEGLERVLQVEETREMIRKEQIENGEIQDNMKTRLPSLVNSSLIDKAREGHNSSAVTKRAQRIWKQHFVSCALCKESFSRHRPADAFFCNECKCHVCSNCDCKVYHLSYQEDLWAEEEGKNEATKKAKKSKKKAKAKEKKAKEAEEQKQVEEQKAAAVKKNQQKKGVGKTQQDDSVGRSRSSTFGSSNDDSGSAGKPSAKKPPVNELSAKTGGTGPASDDDDDTLPLSSPAGNGSKKQGPDV